MERTQARGCVHSKAFDQAELDAAGAANSSTIVAQHTKFAADGASVLFEAEPGNSQWKNNAAVRRVRRALNTSDFMGHSATFQLQLNSSEGLQREVTMSLNGKERRIYLHAQMTVAEVWLVLDEILQYSPAVGFHLAVFAYEIGLGPDDVTDWPEPSAAPPSSFRPLSISSTLGSGQFAGREGHSIG